MNYVAVTRLTVSEHGLKGPVVEIFFHILSNLVTKSYDVAWDELFHVNYFTVSRHEEVFFLLFFL